MPVALIGAVLVWLWRQQPHADTVCREALFTARGFVNTIIDANINEYFKMTFQASDIVPISEARARLTELAEEVVGGGSEKVLTKNGASYVALVDARRLDYYHLLEAEHANLLLAEDAITGLRQAQAGQFLSGAELDEALGACVTSAL